MPDSDATSLVSLAATDSLPAHQFMDAATVDWIASHRPAFPLETERCQLPAVARRVLAAGAGPPHWHAEPRIVESLHGSRHLLRTAAIAALLAGLHGLDEKTTATLVVAAAVHDCRRLDDGCDRGHGWRGGDWLMQTGPEVFGHFGVEYSDEQLEHAATAVRLHEIPYEWFGHAPDLDVMRQKAPMITDLLKTADAADRYRLPKKPWWPKDQFVRIVAPEWVKRLAFELVVESERAFVDGRPSGESVLDPLARWGLI